MLTTSWLLSCGREYFYGLRFPLFTPKRLCVLWDSAPIWQQLVHSNVSSWVERRLYNVHENLRAGERGLPESFISSCSCILLPLREFIVDLKSRLLIPGWENFSMAISNQSNDSYVETFLVKEMNVRANSARIPTGPSNLQPPSTKVVGRSYIVYLLVSTSCYLAYGPRVKYLTPT